MKPAATKKPTRKPTRAESLKTRPDETGESPSPSDLAHVAAPLRPLAVRIASLEPDPENARAHDDANLSAIASSLSTFGQRKPLVVQRRGSRLVVRAGNGALLAARRLGWKWIAALVLEEDDATASAYAVADNRSGDLSRFDDALLAAALSKVEDPALLEATGFSEVDLREIFALAARDLDSAEADDEDSTDGIAKERARTFESEVAPGDGPLPSSDVRLVQLFFDVAGFARFQRSELELRAKLGTSNLTATVEEAVRRVHALECRPA